MRVAMLNYAFDPRIGSPDAVLKSYAHLSGWCRAVGDAGGDVRLVQAFGSDARWHADGFDCVMCATSHSRSFQVANLHAAVRAHQPDVVHVNGLDVPLQVWRLRRTLPPSTAIVVQDHAGEPSRRVFRAAVRRWTMRAPDAYLFTSARQAEGWVQGRYMASTAVREVLSASTSMRPIDRQTAVRQTGVTGWPALLWVGRLNANKDPLAVLDGFEHVLRHLPAATLTMIFQDGDLLAPIQRRLAASGLLGARVRLVGAVPHESLSAWYSAADVFVLGSRREVCCYALVEACACGLSPVVTDIEPFRTMTGGGSVGRLWAAGDAQAFAAAVVDASQEAQPARRARVMDHFDRHLSWRAVGRRAREIYQGVVAERRARL